MFQRIQIVIRILAVSFLAGSAYCNHSENPTFHRHPSTGARNSLQELADDLNQGMSTPLPKENPSPSPIYTTEIPKVDYEPSAPNGCPARPTSPFLQPFLAQQSLETALAALPTDMRERFVVLTECFGSHACSESQPRVINISKNGDTRIAMVSGSNEVQIQAREPRAGKTCFYTSSFDGNNGHQVQLEGNRCTQCHAGRAIWGAYHSGWKNSLGGKLGDQNRLDTFTPHEKNVFSRFVDKASSDAAYKHLLGLSHAATGVPFGGDDPRANTVFTTLVMKSTAKDVSAKLKNDRALFEKYKYALLLSAYRIDCAPSAILKAEVNREYEHRLQTDVEFRKRYAYRPPTNHRDPFRIALLRLFFDPAEALQVDLVASEAVKEQHDIFGYWDGSNRLIDYVDLDVAMEVLNAEAAAGVSHLHTLFASGLNEMQRTYRDLHSEEALPRGLHQYAYPEILGVSGKSEICHYLNERAEQSLRR